MQLPSNMLSTVNKMVIGGAMAYTFLKAQGKVWSQDIAARSEQVWKVPRASL